MANTIHYNLGRTFIHGGATIPYIVWFFREGDIVDIAAYPTDGVPGVVLQVHDIGYEKFVDQNFVWLWKVTFNVRNLGGNGVVCQLYASIISA